MKVLGIGESVVDIETTHQLTGGDQSGETDKSSRHVGGPSTAALVVLARLGHSCTYVTSLGNDFEGDLIRTTLSNEGIKLVEYSQDFTKINHILINESDGQRQKIRSRVHHQEIPYIDIRLILEADMIIVDRHEPKAFRQVVSWKRDESSIIIDSSTEVSDHTINMIKHAEYPIVPIETCAQLAEDGDLMSGLEALYAICGRPVVVTASELGSLIYDGTDVEIIPSLKLKAVAVNGAGDVYRGAFAYGVYEGWDLLKCAQFANGVAGLTCLKVGNVSAIPTKQEMLALLGETKYQTRIVSRSDIDQQVHKLIKASSVQLISHMRLTAVLV